MKNSRLYYSALLSDFLNQGESDILGKIHANDASSQTTIQQKNSWQEEVRILKEQLRGLAEGRVIFEYIIPRIGKRVDCIIIHKNIIFLLEFKCGDSEYRQATYDQVYDYALDLQNFHKESANKLLVPIVVATAAFPIKNQVSESNKIIAPLYCNKDNIREIIDFVSKQYSEVAFDYIKWEQGEYLPTPTIVEAAQALYSGHNVHEITRSDAGAENLTVTSDKINQIIEYSKLNKKKSICFVTGVPGSGKTLVGLNIAIQRSDANLGEHAVFLSGNYPLVEVLREALVRDKVNQEREKGNKISKASILRSVSAFIQIIHKYRDYFIANNTVPPEHVVIFDEAQRAWTHEKIRSFMKTKKGIENFSFSEPEFLISTMERHNDWAVVICLIGGGQEINTGEAGLPEWFKSIKRSFSHWDVYLPKELNDAEYCREEKLSEMLAELSTKKFDELHLANSVRSFRTPSLSAFVKALLDIDFKAAQKLYQDIGDKYPIMLTRNLEKAKAWVKEKSKGSTRYGLVASSGALRLKAEGIFVKNHISVDNWFLNDKTDVRSSYMLEDVATEFDVQGLELDYTIVAWDADYRYSDKKWTYYNLKVINGQI